MGAPSVLDRVAARLRSSGSVFAEDEAVALLTAASSDENLERMVVRRVSGDPLEWIVGSARFAGVRARVLPGVFVPRRRSEVLVRAARTLLAPGARVLDLCCGSGAIGAALLAARPSLSLVAADLHPDAVRCARLNLPGRPVFRGDLFAALPRSLRSSFDLVVVNAPYVPTAELDFMPTDARDHEPALTLDGGEDGVAIHRRIANAARRWLRPGGSVLIETSERQAVETRRAFARRGFATRVLRAEDIDGTAVHARL